MKNNQTERASAVWLVQHINTYATSLSHIEQSKEKSRKTALNANLRAFSLQSSLRICAIYHLASTPQT